MDSTNIQTTAGIIPKIGLGTYALSGGQCISSVADALNMGYRHIDTAQYYNNEAEVGKGMAGSNVPREQIFVTSKIWPSHFPRLEKATEETLAAMKLEQLDLMLLHWPSSDDANKKAVDALLKIHQKGYAKYIGVSNFNIPQMDMALSRAPIICNQVEYHPYIKQDVMLEYLGKHNLALVAYSPLALGKAAKDTLLMQIGKKYNKTSGQVALRWLIQQENVAAIPKASSHEKRMENLDVFNFVLTDEDMEMINSIQKY